MSRKYITEVFKDINEKPALLEQYLIDPVYKTVLTPILQYAFDPDKKWILPAGEPPYRPAPEPMGMTPTNLYGEVRRFYIFQRQDLTPYKRETLFVSLLEGVHPDEANLLIHMKDQKIHKLYKKITRKLVEKLGLVQPLAKKKAVKEDS